MRDRSTSRSTRVRLALAAGGAAALAAATVAASQFAFADTLFTADFEGGTTSGWSRSGGTWQVATDGSRVAQQSSATSANARLFAGDSGWTDYTVQARVKPLSLSAGGQVGLLARARTSTTFYRLALLAGNQVQLQAVNSGTVSVLGSASRAVTLGTWYRLSLEVSGGTVRGFVDGAPVASGSSTVTANGRVGLQTASASASFDDVVVSTAGTGAPTTAAPKPTTAVPTPAPTAPAPTTAPPVTTTWPTKTGDVTVTGTVPVEKSLDGGMKRYCCIGTGGQSESQDPMFVLSDGATLSNVIIGAPAGDGVHCEGDCTLRNVWWEDVGEDAATFRGGTDYHVIGGGARSASDKTFQHNGPGTLHISDFYIENAGKLYRACGNCSTSHERHVVIDNVVAKGTKVLAGINVNFGDTATLSRITILSDPSRTTVICDRFKGVPKGSEPEHLPNTGPDGVNCLYKESDITYR